MRGYPSTSSRATARSDRDEIVVDYWADVVGVQREQRRGSARRGHKLDLQPVWFMDLHHRTEIACAQPVFRQVTGEDNCVEKVIHHRLASG